MRKKYEIPTTVKVKAMITVEADSFQEAITGRLPEDWTREAVIEADDISELDVVKGSAWPIPNGVNAKIRVFEAESGEPLYDGMAVGFMQLRNDPEEWPNDRLR